MPMDRFIWDENFAADPDVPVQRAQEPEAVISMSDSTELNLSNLWIDVGGEA